MSILERLFRKNLETPKEVQRSTDADYWNPIMGTLGWSSYNNYSASKSMKLSVVNRCVEVLTSNIAVLPLQTYTIKGDWKYKTFDDLYYLLNVQPSTTMSAFMFKKFMVQQVLLKGNCYIKINRDEQKIITSFDILDSDYISVLIDNVIIYYNSPIVQGIKSYLNVKSGIVYDDMDIIHIMGYSSNGLVGQSVISSAALSLEISYNSEQHAGNFFESGANSSGFLKPTVGAGNITEEQALKAKEKLQTATSSANQKSGTISVLDRGFDFINTSISPRDSQLLESRAWNLITICQFFGVPPQKVFDFSKSSYTTVEASQIDFLNSTILAWCEKIEIEMYRKIYSRIEYPFTELEFDTSKLLRLDSVAQATYFSQLYNMGAISTNEIRQALNMATPVTGGNKHFIQVNLQDINNLIVDKNNSVDNKLKQ